MPAAADKKAPVLSPLEEHLSHLARPRSRRLPGAVFACGSVQFLGECQSWLPRLQCEVRPEGTARAIYIGTSDRAEDEQYAAFLFGVGRCGIRTCRRLDIERVVPAALLGFLEEASVVWFGHTERPEDVARALARGNADLMERIRWRHSHGALLVGVGGGARLLGQRSWNVEVDPA